MQVAGLRIRSEARVAIGVLVAAVFLVGGASVWQVMESRSTLRENELDQSRLVARGAAAALSADLRGYLRLVEGFAERPQLVGDVARERWSRATAHLRDLRGIGPDIGSAALFDPQGRLWARSPRDPSIVGEDFSYRDYFRGVLNTGGPYLSEVFEQKGTPRAVVVAFAAPIRAPAGGILGVLQATLPVERLGALSSGLGPTEGSLQVFDRKGHAVGGGFDAGRSFVSSPPVVRALAGGAGSGEMRLLWRDGVRLAAYAAVPGVGWAVVVDRPASAAFAPIFGLTARLGIILVVILAALAGGTLVTIRLLRQLERERDGARGLLASLGEGVATTDPDGVVADANPALERLAGWSQNEAHGLPHQEAIRLVRADGEPLPPERRLLTQAIKTGEVVASRGYELRLVARDGRHIPVNVTAAPVRDRRGRLLGGVEVIRDASHEEEVDQLKSSLVSTVSHELRTPLTMIQGFAELLLSRDVGEGQRREALEHIRVSAERLSRLIGDLLSVSRIESGRLAPHPVPLPLRPALEEAIAPFADSRRVNLRVEESAERIVADRDMLVQVATNVVSNAIKYSPAGEPVDVTAQRRDGLVEVSVRDRGIGMSPEEVKRLFQKFSRSDRPEVRSAGGTGLGLYITKQLLEAQGGGIRVETEEGTGSTFTFFLPAGVDRSETDHLQEEGVR